MVNRARIFVYNLSMVPHVIRIQALPYTTSTVPNLMNAEYVEEMGLFLFADAPRFSLDTATAT
jgi:hypothetical protein